MTVSVAIVLTTVLAFSGVYFTTLLFIVILAEAVTYNGTKAIYEVLKRLIATAIANQSRIVISHKYLSSIYNETGG